MAHLLIVDDEPDICWGLRRLTERLGHSAEVASDGEAALKSISARLPDLILMDVRLPGRDGLEIMRQIRSLHGKVPIVIMTAYGDLEIAVQAMRQGAFEYLVKPFELAVVRRIIERALQPSVQSGDGVSVESPDSEGEFPIIGVSASMQEVFKQIALVAPTDAAVLLQGESGTGKELVARAIHRFSRRRDGPFIVAHLASLSPSLAESELFGHVRGAFTGAEESRTGLLERADGGTLFIDEAADIPLLLQVKLLRALEYREFLPVGGTRPVRSDFRLISASHRDIARLAAENKFRHDFYFRLVTFEVRIPPLRDRREDIEPLVRHFVRQLSQRMGIDPPSWDRGFLEELELRPWRGNVRELRSALEYAMILARGGALRREMLPPPLLANPADSASPAVSLQELIRRWADAMLKEDAATGDLYDRFLQVVEPPLLRTVLQRCGGRYLAAAKVLGMHRVTLRRKLQQYGSEDGSQAAD
ncbi:sigma-54-dependent transcriptional regulator [Thermopirellula anaerolimosa]